jgi:hypothetical protein
MNTQFVDIIATGQVIICMDDILIATHDNKEEHRKIVHQVLGRLWELDLYLKPAKCTFKTKKIEFLGVSLENGSHHGPGKNRWGRRMERTQNSQRYQKILGIL